MIKHFLVAYLLIGLQLLQVSHQESQYEILVRTLNMARNKPTWQSSTYPPYAVPLDENAPNITMATSDSSNAVDGKADPKHAHSSCSHTGVLAVDQGTAAWWAVDLGRATHVRNIVLTIRGAGDCCAEQFRNVIIGLTNTSPAVAAPDTLDNSLGRTILTIPFMVYTGLSLFPDPCPFGRYLYVIQPVPPLTICEIQVYEYTYKH